MVILGIETSCDETAAAILQRKNNRIQILSNVVASSASLQAKYGGVIPEQAAREQIKVIIPVIEEALEEAFGTGSEKVEVGSGTLKWEMRKSHFSHQNHTSHITPLISKIDAIAVTYGPGLIGSLLVGVETAKTLALVWNKPLIPVNHLIGHFYANWITDTLTHRPTDTPKFPYLGLLVSGGHTDLVLFIDHGKYKYLGGTRDDAAGECFDKCARLLGLPYPGGPEISKLATKGDSKRFKLPVPMKGDKSLDFSYSGLKTAVANIVKTLSVIPTSEDPSLIVQDDNTVANLAAAIENAIVESLIDKVILALKKYPVKDVMVAGGVAANQKLVDRLQVTVGSLDPNIRLHIPPAELCTDNAAMIASAAFFQKPIKNPLKLQADPNLSLTRP